MIEAIGKRIVSGYKFIHPIIMAVFIATFLVLITVLSSFTLTATVFSEEGGGKGAASAGLANAAIFLIIAIVGGFLIFLLFKYKKKNAIQYLFGSALSLSGGFILFFFLIILIEDIIYYSSGLLVYSSFLGGSTADPFFLVFNQANFELPLFLSSLAIGIVMTYIILSGRFKGAQKNRFLLLLSGLMGAFLAVILPTWTVMFMLIGLSFYDIYSVKRGPIKSIIEMTEEDRKERMKRINTNRKRDEALLEAFKINNIICVFCGSNKVKVGRDDGVTCHSCNRASIIPGVTALVVDVIGKFDNEEESQEPVRSHANKKRHGQRGREKNLIKRDEEGLSPVIPFVVGRQMNMRKKRFLSKKGMDAEHLMKSMTYNTEHWDLGIGDLVFYSMLVGHSFQFGAGYYEKIGLFAPILMFGLSFIGIATGFVITIRMLERNKILPGLPMSMFIGIFGFSIGAAILWLW
ncbi:MAG: hypothetical protein QGH39_07860 [Candidatus Thermoplasmatota archaeon]|jgi:hypothetical protein|nr:hypothetical protein [Candidatus Thermoplasmatota archaeon]MDP7265460.1 hypothetical protein [Candidatus Thermoplasmatota archaeon]